ncbi:MAG: hypothetical protein QXJ97_02925 [Desulfurococcaceae archaeon]
MPHFAHLLYSFTLYRLGLKSKDLLYNYEIDKQGNKVAVAVIENNPYGSLDLIKHIVSVTGNVISFVREFLESVVGSLEKHEKDLERYARSAPTHASSNLVSFWIITTS